MKRLTLILLSLACSTFSGCGVLFVDPALRAACPATSDGDINAIIGLAEFDRQSGYGLSEEVRAVADSCGNDDACTRCLTAVVSWVYRP